MGLVAMWKLGCPVLQGVDISDELHGMVERERILGRESDEKNGTKEKGKIRNS